MRCLFCLEERPPGDEHIFPRAIGGTLRTDRVCDPCNSVLGATVDAPLTDHFLIALRRSHLKLAGNSGNVPDEIDLMLGTGILASDPSRRIRTILNPETGKLDSRVLYSASDVTLDDGTMARRIIIDERDAGRIGTIIQRERKRAGVSPLPDEELARQVAEFAAGIEVIDNPEVHVRIDVDTVAFRRGLLKIGYELACLWLGDAYLDDPTGATLRGVVLGRQDEEEAGVLAAVGFGADIPSLRFWAEDKDCHLAFNLAVAGRMAVCVRVFDIFSAVIDVTGAAGRYAAHPFDPRVVRFVHIDPVSSSMRQSSFMDEICRIVRSKRRGFQD